jgi:pimeloyl-ACP methyl ester carboxylesterase
VYRERDGMMFHWFEAGTENAEPLVMIHGFMAHAMAFRRVVQPLGDRYRLIFPDLPAHGRDPSYQHPDVHPTIDSLEEWLYRFRRAVIGDRPAHGVGHSLGANLLYRVARRDPEAIRSLGLVSPGLRIPGSAFASSVLKHFPPSLAMLGANRLGLALYQPMNWRGERMSPQAEETYLRPMKSKDRVKFMLELGSRLLDGTHPDLTPLDIPTLVMWGRHDHMLPVEDAYWIRERLGPRTQLHIIEASGHSPMEDTPEEFTRTILDFCSADCSG